MHLTRWEDEENGSRSTDDAPERQYARSVREQYDLAVIGAGSGGIGAALAGARLGLSVLLVEKADTIGGTATRGGVHTWEPGVGGTGIPFEIYRRLKQIPDAVGVYSYGRQFSAGVAPGEPPFPGGEVVMDPSRRYADTLRRHPGDDICDDASRREHWHGVVFEPEQYTIVVEDMLAETERCTLLKNTALRDVNAESGRIGSILLDDGREVEAGAYVDCTGDGVLCTACGCESMTGQESRRAFDEPDAPQQASDRVNGVSLIYRVTPTDQARVEALPSDIPAECWWAPSFPAVRAAHYPCGDCNMNMLPTMEGEEFVRLGYRRAYSECRRRVRAHWHHCQTVFPEFRGYRLSWIAPMLGVRESRRIVGEYVLTEHDLLAGIRSQQHPDIIAIADHAMDRHGAGGGCPEVREPYGVPYRCLIAKGFRNLLVACRAASFSSIAASSCRLSRTMMQLGQAAGTAAAVAKQLGVPLPEVPPDALRRAPREQHAQLDWPTPRGLLEYLDAEQAQ
jgi:hypothetical protein